MKTVLFFPKMEKSFRAPCAPLGLMSIATYLNNSGHTAVICDRFFDNRSIERILDENTPKVIGISVSYHSFLKDAIYISKIAKKRNIIVIWGGSYATAIDDVILKSGVVDFVVINEGEITWLEICDKVDRNESIYDVKKGLSYMRKGQYIKTPERDFIDLSELPALDWSLVDPKKYFQKTYGYNRMITTYYSKGCGGRCTYCYNPGFHHSKRRCRKLETVISEMKTLVEEYGADGFDFSDDLLFANRAEAIDFCEKIKESKLNICWSGYLSVGVLNSVEDFKTLYDAGCRSLIFGIESGSEKMLRRVNKFVRLDKVKSNVDFCNEAGIVPITMFILALPGEDEEDIRETLNLARSLKGASVGYNFFTPVPGSKLYSELVESNKIPKITDFNAYAEMNGFERLFANFTNVPTKDLLIIKKYIRLRGIFSTTNNSNSEQFVKAFLSVAKSWCGRGFIQFVKNFGFTALSTVSLFSIFFYPSVRKKYGLYFKNVVAE